MERFSLVSLALAAALAIAPSASADEFNYTISGQDFAADLTFTASQMQGQAQGVDLITGVSGWFNDPDSGLVTMSSSNPATAISANGATASNYADSGLSEYDNLLYTTETGDGILDWGGVLFSVGGYQLNIFSDSDNGGAGYFYWTDNGATHWSDPIPSPLDDAAGGSGTPPPASGNLTSAPEPGSLLLFGTGLLGLAAVLFRQAKLCALRANS